MWIHAPWRFSTARPSTTSAGSSGPGFNSRIPASRSRAVAGRASAYNAGPSGPLTERGFGRGLDHRKEPMSANATLEIKNLHVAIEGKAILKGLNLTVKKGEIHALMGPNGSGKSTLANALMGNPKYEVTEGKILLNGEDLLELAADERGRKGLFLAFQYPTAIPGVSVANFLRMALTARRKEMGEEKPLPPKEFRALMKEKMAILKMDDSFAGRYINDGFSGGEKKRAEILQMAVLRPEIAVLDETDSGLDIDALRFVAEAVNRMRGPQLGVLIITHYTRVLQFIKPDFVHVLVDGRFVLSGGPEVADRLEKTGYAEWGKEEETPQEVA